MPCRSLRTTVPVAAALVIGLATTTAAENTMRVRGKIDAFDGQTMHVTARDDSKLTIKLADNASIAGVVKASLGDIKVGTYVGVAGTPQPGGRQRALEVVIFPEAMRGTAEGFGPWDLRPKSTMTNATVAAVVDKTEGNTMNLKYKGGERTIVVPPEAPIVSYVPGDKNELKPGAAIFVASAAKQADGTLVAQRVGVGRDGLVPPM